MTKSLTTGYQARAIAAGFGAVAVAAALVTGSARAAAQNDVGRCSERTLDGPYGFLISGFKAVPPPLGGGLERFNAVGIWDFDGRGSFTYQPGGALIGETTGVNPEPVDPVGTYAINDNCSGTMEWQPDPAVPATLRFTIVVVDNARTVKLGVRTGLAQGEMVRQ